MTGVLKKTPSNGQSGGNGLKANPSNGSAAKPKPSASRYFFDVVNNSLSRSRVLPVKRTRSSQEENEGSAGHGSPAACGEEDHPHSEGGGGCSEGNHHESSNSARSNAEKEGAAEDGGEYDSDTNGNGKYLVGVT